MHLVAALDAAPGMRAVLGLFEGVVTGAADGYARMAEKPALTLTHLGPGFANGIANLHNARRASTPVVNVIGDQATWHLAADAPLTSDVESLAKPVSVWVHKVKTAAEVGPGVAQAIAAARRAPGGVATLIVPADCAWGESPGAARPVAFDGRTRRCKSGAVDGAARALRAGEPALILLGGNALSRRGSLAAARVAAKSGARVNYVTFPARVERGAGLPAFAKFPYFPEQGVGAARLGAPARARGRDRAGGVLRLPERAEPAHARRLSHYGVGEARRGRRGRARGARRRARRGTERGRARNRAPRSRPPPASSRPRRSAARSRRCSPKARSSSTRRRPRARPGSRFAGGALPHSSLGLTGGAIGQGLPNAVGAAIACPDRRVIALQADGSGMYTVQSLWTAARESLDLKVIVCANRMYRILKVELARADISQPGPAARALTDLGQPNLDWVSLARGMGVPGESVDTTESFAAALGRAFAAPGPYLVEAVL